MEIPIKERQLIIKIAKGDNCFILDKKGMLSMDSLNKDSLLNWQLVTILKIHTYMRTDSLQGGQFSSIVLS